MQANIPQVGDIVLAGVSPLKPLQPGDYGIVFTTSGLMVGHGVCPNISPILLLNLVTVLAIYVKSGGASGKHGSVTTLEKIAQASYIAVQLFEHRAAEHFIAIPEATALLGTLNFSHLPSHAFLFALSPPPSVHSNGDLRLSPESSSLFKDLQAALPCVKEAMKLFGKRKRQPEPQLDTDEEA